jgi:DNA-binding CsgD family transcriptional regulator
MNAINNLTKQESNVLARVGQGKRNAEIARELYLSVRTVEGHLRSIFKKLNFSSRTEAAIYAFENGLLPKPKSGGTTQDGENVHDYYKSHQVNGSTQGHFR